MVSLFRFSAVPRGAGGAHFFPAGRGAAALVTSMMLAACAPTGSGTEPLQARPTIVSLNPCSDAILAEVAAPGQLLAVSHYSHEAASSSMGVEAARRFPAVSGSVEEVAALAPDMVVADVFLAPATAQAFRDLGIRVVTIGSTNTVAAGVEQVREIARTSGNIESGEALVTHIETALAASARAPAEKRMPAIVWQSGGIVAGDQTLIADLLARTGFVNAAAARGLGQADYLPLEAMLADPPALILAAGDERSQEDRLLAHPALAALKDTRRVRFDSALLWCGGPTIIRAVTTLARIRRTLRGASLTTRTQ